MSPSEWDVIRLAGSVVVTTAAVRVVLRGVRGQGPASWGWAGAGGALLGLGLHGLLDLDERLRDLRYPAARPGVWLMIGLCLVVAVRDAWRRTAQRPGGASAEGAASDAGGGAPAGRP